MHLRRALSSHLPLSLALLVGCGAPGTQPSPSEPSAAPNTAEVGGPAGAGPNDVLGQLDVLDDTGHAIGWALTPAFTSHPLETAVFCDGDVDTGTLVFTVRANRLRDDVSTALGIPGRHGLEFDLPDPLRDGQPHVLHIYGLGPTAPVELGGSPRTFQLAGAGTGNAPRAGGSTDVIGVADVVEADGRVTGWAQVPSFTGHPIETVIYADGDATTGDMLFTSRANLTRDDVVAATGVVGSHGFEFLVPESLMNAKPHSLTLYAIGVHGLQPLSDSPRTFALASPTPMGVVDVVDAGGTLSGWALVPVKAPASIDVDLYLDGPEGTGALLGTVHADRPRGDVNQATGYAGDHGFAFTVPDSARDGHAHQLFVYARGPRGTMMIGQPAFTLAPVFPSRPGIVHADGRNYVDDRGGFYPLGGTLMWALYGWKYDRDRVKDNLKFLAKHHYDYVRILAEVDWAGEAIDPRWPDHAQLLGELVDFAYDECGLRTEITIIGGGSGVDVLALTHSVAGVVSAGRRHKVLDLEVANESYGRPVSLQTMRDAGAYLMQNLPGQLVAISSAEGLGAYVPSSTDFLGDTIATFLQAGTANLLTIHMDRTFGDGGWRETRQPWDWKDQGFPISHNEPIGPRSSVAEEVDPIRLAMLRAVGIINGVEAFVLHNAAGVAGRVDPAHNRPANLWEVPNIDAIMDAVRGVDALLPPRVGDGRHWNNGWAGDPWNADAFWSDGADHGVNRNYTVATPDGWVSTETGIKGYVVMTAARRSRVEIFDVLQGKVKEVVVEGGQTYTLTSVSLDSGGMGALIVVGHFL